MSAVGLDLGGTKIEAQVFDADWRVVARQRVSTPQDYGALVAAVAGLVRWADPECKLPVGISSAGLVNPANGLALTANLPATGRPLPADIAAAAGRAISYVNDCRALTLSEAVFGAARGRSPAVGLILGTGIGGGVAFGGRLLTGPAEVGGEFGHFGLSAAVVMAHGLPVVRCGCGRMGCTETLIAGPGMGRIAQAMLGRVMEPREIAAARGAPGVDQVWKVWLELLAELVMVLSLTVDPDCVVLGGGLSKIDGLAGALQQAVGQAQWTGFGVPEILIAEGGDASGARGAAFAAVQEVGNG